MLRQMFVPPGAGGNFIALHSLWSNQYYVGPQYEHTKINRFNVPRQRSTLWDCNNKISSDHELVFSGMYPELKKYWDVWESTVELPKGWITRFALSNFFRLMLANGVTPSEYEVLTRDYFWLPIFDYSIYYGMQGGKSDQLDFFCKHLMDMCWEVHKKQNESLISIAHYHPGQDFEGYNYSTDVEKLCVSIESCEEYISDMMTIKSNVQDENSPNHPPDGKRHEIYNNVSDQQKSDIILEYKKIFFYNDLDEIRELYKFCDNEDFFNANKEDISDWFKSYNANNQKLVHEFDWDKSGIDRIGK